MENEFLILLQAKLDEAKSKGNINSDIEKIQSKIEKLKLQAEIDPKVLTNLIKQMEEVLNVLNQEITLSNIKIDQTKINQSAQQIDNAISENIASGIENGSKKVESESRKLADQIEKIKNSIDNGYGSSEYQNQINSITSSLEKYGVETEKIRNLTSSLQSTFDQMKGMSEEELISQAGKLEQEFKKVKVSVEEAKIAYDKYMQPVTKEKASSLINRINTFLSKNTKITKEARAELEGYTQEIGKGVNLGRWNEISGKVKETENSMRGLHRLGASLKDQMSQAAQSFGQWLSVSSAVMLLVSKTKNAVSELKEVNTLLTEISKANDKLSKSDLSKIGNDSFDVASKYGKTATDYLSGVQEASRAGYENAMQIAELSVAAQGAGDMTAELANQYIIATDKAYKLSGSVEKLTEVLDGSNYITNHNAVNMTELAEGMSVVGSQAASSQMEVNEITAAIGTMVATTQKSGREMGNAFKGILMNLQQVTGDVGDGEDIIDAESLTKYEKACAELGVSLKEVKNGVVSLKEPMQIIKELSEEYNKLDKADAKRANLLNAVGGKYRANALNSLLENYDMYTKMLDEYSQGMGSMAAEAEKTANSWEGSLNRLSNTWTDTIGNIVNSDAVITLINGLNGVISVVNNITDSLGSLSTIGLGSGIIASVKNVGRPKMSGLICY